MLKKTERHQLLPGWGYVVLNLVFLAVMVAIYFFSNWYAARNTFFTSGLFPVLFICYVAFTFLCIFDGAFDRYLRRREQRQEKEIPTEDAPSSSSKENTSKIESA